MSTRYLSDYRPKNSFIYPCYTDRYHASPWLRSYFNINLKY